MSDALSAGCIREERFAGKLFREMMERQRLYAASGHFRALTLQTGASLQRKPLRMGSLLVTKSLRPSVFVPRLGAVPRSPPLSGDVRVCAPSLLATI